MKNTVIVNLNNNVKCECIESFADGTNRIIIEMKHSQYHSPIFALYSGSDTEVLNGKVVNESTREIEIPYIWVESKKTFHLSITDQVINARVEFSTLNIVPDQNMIIKNDHDVVFTIYMKIPSPNFRIATKDNLGVVQIGENLKVTDEGILSADVSREDIERLEEEIKNAKAGAIAIRTIERPYQIIECKKIYNEPNNFKVITGIMTTYEEVE